MDDIKQLIISSCQISIVKLIVFLETYAASHVLKVRTPKLITNKNNLTLSTVL